MEDNFSILNSKNSVSSELEIKIKLKMWLLKDYVTQRF
tara:strand:+ start:65 stop:178 length:114 start_codon:yes stop_codon:yes gene_type:complete